MPSTLNHRCTGAVVIATDVAVLRVGWVPPAELATHLAHPRRWVDSVGTDAATLELARAGLWLTGVWLALAVIAVLASGLPGTVGRAADAMAGRAVPAVLRRAIATALGASVVLVPVAASASTNGAHVATAASATTSSMAATSAASAMNLSGGWPWPTSAPTTTAGPASATPAQPVPWPHSAVPAARSSSGYVTVRAGDCLWAIAARRLGPHASAHRIATETQRWYDANAAAIGADPGLIHPGQQLHQPTEKGR